MYRASILVLLAALGCSSSTVDRGPSLPTPPRVEASSRPSSAPAPDGHAISSDSGSSADLVSPAIDPLPRRTSAGEQGMPPLAPHVDEAPGRVLVGSLSKEQIATLRVAFPRLRACWEASGATNVPTIRFTIASDGAVRDVQFVPDHGGTLEVCIRDALLSFRFPEPSDGGIVVVTYPGAKA